MPMNQTIKTLSALHRRREVLRAKIVTLTNDLADIDSDMKKLAAAVVGPPTEEKES